MDLIESFKGGTKGGNGSCKIHKTMIILTAWGELKVGCSDADRVFMTVLADGKNAGMAYILSVELLRKLDSE